MATDGSSATINCPRCRALQREVPLVQVEEPSPHDEQDPVESREPRSAE
jgi:hypothetical protein